MSLLEPDGVSSPAEVPSEARPAPSATGRLWPAGRIALANHLWGEGFTLPGGEEEALRLARPLGLSAAASLILLGAGSGGAVRTIASHLGVWVSGFEADPDLAAAGDTHCATSGLGRRAQIATWEPENPGFPRRYYHHAVAIEAMRFAKPETTLAAIALSLRPGGQVMALEVVVDEPSDHGTKSLARWMEMEGRKALPPSAALVGKALGRLGFEVRVAEDVSQRHISHALRGWRHLVAALKQDRPDPAQAALIVREAELWLLRARLMREGRIRLVRWHAIARSADPALLQ